MAQCPIQDFLVTGNGIGKIPGEVRRNLIERQWSWIGCSAELKGTAARTKEKICVEVLCP